MYNIEKGGKEQNLLYLVKEDTTVHSIQAKASLQKLNPLFIFYQPQ